MTRRAPVSLWTFQSKILKFTTTSQKLQLYPPPGPLMAEWFLIEADVNNDDIVAIGESDVATFVLPVPLATQCITTLSPGEWCVWEPNDKGDDYNNYSFVDGEAVEQTIQLEDIDLIDVCQFWAVSGRNTVVGLSLHMTLGYRSRREP